MSERPKAIYPANKKSSKRVPRQELVCCSFFSGLGLNKCLRYSVPCSQPVMPFATQLCRAFP